MAQNINATLENLREAIDAMVEVSGACCQRSGGPIDPPPNSNIPAYGGIDDDWQSGEEYFDARCNASNGIHDTLRGLAHWLQVNHIDLKAGAFGGITTGIVTALLLAGPGGWAITAVGGIVAILAGWVIAEAFDFERLKDALDDEQDDLVMALYNSQDVNTARSDYLTILAASSGNPSDEEVFLIRVAMGYELLNQIFNPRDDMANYASPSPVVCSTGATIWTFDTGAQGWVFEDESEGTQLAEGVWVSGKEAWELELTITGGGGPFALGTIRLTGLSIAVDIGNSVALDYSETSDGYNSNNRIRVTYSDTSESYNAVNTKVAGTIIASVPGPKTISMIECSAAREAGEYNYTIDLLEVRVQ